MRCPIHRWGRLVQVEVDGRLIEMYERDLPPDIDSDDVELVDDDPREECTCNDEL